jgi:acetyltransferase-like isoleucine patch superfamily enzyme
MTRDLRHSLKIMEWKALHSSRFATGNKLTFGRLFAIHFDASASAVSIGDDVQFRDYCQIRSGMDGRLTIGSRVFFNNGCTINCFHEIEIGNDCQFGEAVRFYDVNHNYHQGDLLISDQGYSREAIRIGANCWFGTSVVVLKGVTVGDNVVVGAGCILRESVPSNSVVTNGQELKIKASRTSTHGD